MVKALKTQSTGERREQVAQKYSAPIQVARFDFLSPSTGRLRVHGDPAPFQTLAQAS